jgi:acyl-CoA oxidase
MEAATSTEIETVDAGALRELLDGRHRIVREHTRAILARDDFSKPSDPLPTDEYRELVAEWTRKLAQTGGPALLFPEEFGGLGRVGEAIASFETLGLSDLSLLVKCGVQFGLFGGAVHHLGTRKHHERYLEKIATFELPGAFAMSESGHGSNVQNVKTTATYEPESDELVIETPQGLHRQRRARRPPGGRLLPTDRGRRGPRRALRARPAARRIRRRRRGRAHRGLWP